MDVSVSGQAQGADVTDEPTRQTVPKGVMDERDGLMDWVGRSPRLKSRKERESSTTRETGCIQVKLTGA